MVFFLLILVISASERHFGTQRGAGAQRNKAGGKTLPPCLRTPPPHFFLPPAAPVPKIPVYCIQMTLEELELLLLSCQNGNRLSQKRLYQQFYGFGMSICNRYAQHHEEAEEMCHDGFVKVFSKIGDCAGVGSFKGWMRQIFVRSAIDYFRKHRQSQPPLDDIEMASGIPAVGSTALDNISTDEKLRLVQRLPPAYRLAFNLYAVEGFSTAEIADLLHVAEGTVRANLAKARIRLQTLILESDKISATTTL